jgi:hypothetical protein
VIFFGLFQEKLALLIKQTSDNVERTDAILRMHMVHLKDYKAERELRGGGMSSKDDLKILTVHGDADDFSGGDGDGDDDDDA